MWKAYSLSKSRATDRERAEAGYFQVVRELILQLTSQGGTTDAQGNTKLSLKEVNEKISALLQENLVQSEGVISLFQVEDDTISTLDPKFLESLKKMPEKNLAYEMLKRLLKEQVKTYAKKSVTQAKKYSELMQGMVNAYLNGQLSNAEVFEEMLKLAQEMMQDNNKAKELGLNDEEFAFYEALIHPEAIADFYEGKSDELVAITQELTAKMRELRTVDWNKKESVRSKMRTTIKRLLKKHGYPPEGRDYALQTVMEQCELWADNAV